MGYFSVKTQHLNDASRLTLIRICLWGALALVKESLGEKDGVLFGGDTKLVVEGVVPDLLHVIPIGDYAMFDGVLERQDSTSQ